MAGETLKPTPPLPDRPDLVAKMKAVAADRLAKKPPTATIDPALHPTRHGS